VVFGALSRHQNLRCRRVSHPQASWDQPPPARDTTAENPYTRYEQKVPGHQIQVDVKFLTFQGKDGNTIKRYQYTAIDDATRVRALRIFDRHTQANAIAFIDYVTAKFPFRIREVRTDNGHEFQAKFHWHVEDQGIRHAYIKPNSPQLNGKVERSHRTDAEEFYQLLTYTDDVDLQA
jgi:transposase InsO family protein